LSRNVIDNPFMAIKAKPKGRRGKSICEPTAQNKATYKGPLILGTPILIAALVLGIFVDTWIVALILIGLAALIFIPLGISAKRELKRLAKDNDDSQPNP
jgi:cadmium resistance protein CadD (predicted permease)